MAPALVLPIPAARSYFFAPAEGWRPTWTTTFDASLRWDHAGADVLGDIQAARALVFEPPGGDWSVRFGVDPSTAYYVYDHEAFAALQAQGALEIPLGAELVR